MKKILILTFSLFLGFSAVAQEEKSKIKDKLFLGLVTSYYIDFVSSPLKIVDFSRLLDDGNGGVIQTPDTAVPFQTRYISFVSIGFEPRYNIHEFNENVSIGIAMPATIGFGQAYPHNNDVSGARGFGNVQVPLLAKLYFGTNATYDSKADFGFSAGAGVEYNKLALIATDEDKRVKEANRGWIMPTFSGSVHFWRGNSPIEVNFKYGHGIVSTYRTNAQGFPLPDGERITRANSIKLSFVYLLNY